MSKLRCSEVFAEVIRARRATRGLTLEDLGRRCGIGKGYLSMIERGLVGPPLPPQILALSKALQVGARDLAFIAHMDGAPRLVSECESFPAVAVEVKRLADGMILGGDRVVRPKEMATA